MKQFVIALILLLQMPSYAHFKENGRRLGWHHHEPETCEATTDNLSVFKDPCKIAHLISQEMVTECSGKRMSTSLCINAYNCKYPNNIETQSSPLHIRGGKPLTCYTQCFDNKIVRAENQYENGKISFFELTHIKYKEGEATFIELYDAIEQDFNSQYNLSISDDKKKELAKAFPDKAVIQELQTKRFAHLFGLGLDPKIIDKIFSAYTIVGEAGGENIGERAAVYAMLKNRAQPDLGSIVQYKEDGKLIVSCRRTPSKGEIESTIKQTGNPPKQNTCDKKFKPFRSSTTSRAKDYYSNLMDSANDRGKIAIQTMLDHVTERNNNLADNSDDTTYNITMSTISYKQFSFHNANDKQTRRKASLYSIYGRDKEKERRNLVTAFEAIDALESGHIEIKFNNRPYNHPTYVNRVTHYATPETSNEWTKQARPISGEYCIKDKGCKPLSTKKHTFYYWKET